MAVVESVYSWEQLCASGVLSEAPMPTRSGLEYRNDERSLFPYRMLLEPLDCIETRWDEIGVEVLGDTISANGFSFTHAAPLPYRQVRILANDPRLEEQGQGDLVFSMIVKWCRFYEPGHYQSGGRILWPQAQVA